MGIVNENELNNAMLKAYFLFWSIYQIYSIYNK